MRLVACLAVMFALLGCENKQTGPEAVPSKEKGSATTPKKDDGFVAGTKADMFTVALAADPETFDPGKMSGAPEGRLSFQIFEGLMMPGITTEKLSDPSKLVTPGVAEKFDVSEDGKTYTFTLRKDAKWTNGDPVTASDFAYAWQRVLTKETGADYVTMLWVIEGAEQFTKGEIKDFSNVGIVAKDDHTLIVTLKNPTPYFPELTAFYTYFPVPKKMIEKHGDQWTKPENIVTNGAYKLAKYAPQQEVILEANENYWDKSNVKIEKAKFRIIADANARVNAYKTGELHWTGAGLPVAQITSLLAHDDYFREPMLGIYYYRMNVDKDSPLKDPKVRQALSKAIDRETLVNNTMNGLFTVAESQVPTIPGYTSTTKTSYNIKAAKDLMKEAGFEKGKGFPKMNLLYNTDENHKLVAEAIQDMWKRNLGIELTLVNKEWKTYLQDTDTLQYDIARAGWIGDYNDPMTFLEMFTSEDGNNDTGWKNADYDKLIESARAEADKSKRVALLQKAEEMLLTVGPVIPIYVYSNNMLRSRKIEGFEAHNRDVHLLKYMSLPK